MNDFSENWRKLRLRAGKKAELLGNAWPTKKEEAYHYASLSSLDKKAWAEPVYPEEESIAEKIFLLDLPEVKNRMVFANGYFISSLSFLEDGGDWKVKKEERVSEKSFSFEERLNDVFRKEQLLLKVSSRVDLSELQLLFLNEGKSVSFHPSVVLQTIEGQKLSVCEVHVGDGEFLENALVEVKCEKSSTLFWTKAQLNASEAASLSLTDFSLEKSARVSFTLLAKGSAFAREVVRAELKAENAFLETNGLQLSGKNQLVDFNVSIAHEANHTESQQSLKTLVSGNGHAIFQGKSAISKRGNKSSAHQKSDALLLSDKGIFDVKPELEIFADDVKCSHGATVGALDDQDIFYIRSRGVSLGGAKRLLLFSFVNEVLDRISDEKIRFWAQAHVFPFLGGGDEEIFGTEEKRDL
ncbi:hypothetical protein FAI40_00570 [Acetobacteraceae bacterium]|nr:hypothetical protein FAI40_00570 [Acetobacteraceae bacterium]